MLVSLEKVMVRFPGRSLGSLHTLTRELASQCIFGGQYPGTIQRKWGNNTSQFDPEKLKYINTLVQGRTNMSDTEFESTSLNL